MKRRVHIQFRSKELITVTNFACQKEIDLSSLDKDDRVDLITLKSIQYNSDFFAVINRWDDEVELRIYSKATQDSAYVDLGSGSVKEFVYRFANPSNDYKQDTNEGSYETFIA